MKEMTRVSNKFETLMDEAWNVERIKEQEQERDINEARDKLQLGVTVIVEVVVGNEGIQSWRARAKYALVIPV